MSAFPAVIHHNPDCGTYRNVLGIIQAAGYVPTPRPVDLPVEGAAGLKEAVIPAVLHYSTADPLGEI